jgi:transposase-like protein
MTKITLIFAIFFALLKERIHGQVLERFEKEKQKPEKKRNLITFVSEGGVAKLVHGVPIGCRKYGLEHNNNPIERHNEDIRQRYRIMREFKSFYSADDFLKLRRIYTTLLEVIPD